MERQPNSQHFYPEDNLKCRALQEMAINRHSNTRVARHEMAVIIQSSVNLEAMF